MDKINFGSIERMDGKHDAFQTHWVIDVSTQKRIGRVFIDDFTFNINLFEGYQLKIVNSKSFPPKIEIYKYK